MNTKAKFVGALGYETLADILNRAHDQAAYGKGHERHADAKPFDIQPMQSIADRRGLGFLLGQADKKSEEAQGMLERGHQAACVAELLGAINYIAGAILFIERTGKPQVANDNFPVISAAALDAQVAVVRGNGVADHG